MAEKTTSFRAVFSLVTDSMSTLTALVAGGAVGLTLSRLLAALLGFTASEVADDARLTAVRAGRDERRLVPAAALFSFAMALTSDPGISRGCTAGNMGAVAGSS